jgi:PKD repeat protein
MATYYVDGSRPGNSPGDGSSAQPWKTLASALERVQPGDEVRVRTATYRETLSIGVRNTTWKADTGHRPVLDGRYNEELFNAGQNVLPPPSSGNYLPTRSGHMISCREEGVTVDGFIIQNSAGGGVGVSRSNVTVRNCRIDFTYDSAVTVNPGAAFIDNVVVENNVCTRVSMKYYDPTNTSGGQGGVSGVIKMGRTRDGFIRNNVCAYGFGEGINVGKGSYRITVEGNVVHTCNHVHIYINRSVDTIVRNNLVYHLHTPAHLGPDNEAPAGIIIGDESTSRGEWPSSAGGEIYNNLVVGTGKLFQVRNNSKNYDTQLDGCYIGYNTFVGNSTSVEGISIVGNLHGRPHRRSIFENNVICCVRPIGRAGGDLSGIAFRNNLWSDPPPGPMRGRGDQLGDPHLVNPGARIEGGPPDPNTSIDPRNYQLTTRSALAIGKASDGSRVNDLTPPQILKDFFGGNRSGAGDIGGHDFDGAPPSEPIPNFTIGAGQESGRVPHTVDFTDRTFSSRPIVARQWDFGDGETSTETNPSHTYEEEGDFTVSLTVTDDRGNTRTMTVESMIAVVVVFDDQDIIPDTFRRFVLVDPATRRFVAYGSQYPDMRCILVWRDEPHHMLNFDDVDDLLRSYLKTVAFLWVDPADEIELELSGDDDAEPIP